MSTVLNAQPGQHETAAQLAVFRIGLAPAPFTASMVQAVGNNRWKSIRDPYETFSAFCSCNGAKRECYLVHVAKLTFAQAGSARILSRPGERTAVPLSCTFLPPSRRSRTAGSRHALDHTTRLCAGRSLARRPCPPGRWLPWCLCLGRPGPASGGALAWT
jgi:hypothetical protein